MAFIKLRVTITYVQSKTGDIFKRAEEKLKSGITVLFSGLPCHIAGLYSYLGQDYDNLYTIDMLCNNVPSIKALHKFLDEKFGLEKIKHIDFRYKKLGKEINDICLCVETETFLLDSDNSYYRAFVERKLAGKHCEDCKFGAIPRVADISLGDIYGAEKVNAWFAPLKTESVLINSKKGESLVQSIKELCTDYQEIPIDIIKQMHPILHSKWPVSPKRNQTYEMLGHYSFEQACRAVMEGKYNVGIVGVATNPNYGGALTYLALKWVLEDLGKSSLMIIPPGSDLIWLPKRITNFKHNPYYDYEIVCYPDKESMTELNDKCDMFMVGSDQLFSTHFKNNGIYAECDEFASLDWVFDRKKKVAYAASFGEELINCPDDMKARMAYYIQKFDDFSVREKSAVNLCKKEFNIDSKRVLDPIFLVNKKKYFELVDAIIIKEANLFSYILDADIESNKIVESVQVENNFTMNSIGDSAIQIMANVEEWLKSIIRADFIITDSFHCACFAVIFNIPFIVIRNRKRGEARFDLFYELGLGNRVVVSFKEYLSKKDNIFSEINWEAVNEKIEVMKKASMEILKKQLEPKIKASSEYDILNGKISDINQNVMKLLADIKLIYNSMINLIGNEECIIFGAGKYGEKCATQLNQSNIIVKYFLDNDVNKQNRGFSKEKSLFAKKAFG